MSALVEPVKTELSQLVEIWHGEVGPPSLRPGFGKILDCLREIDCDREEIWDEMSRVLPIEQSLLFILAVSEEQPILRNTLLRRSLKNLVQKPSLKALGTMYYFSPAEIRDNLAPLLYAKGQSAAWATYFLARGSQTLKPDVFPLVMASHAWDDGSLRNLARLAVPAERQTILELLKDHPAGKLAPDSAEVFRRFAVVLAEQSVSDPEIPDDAAGEEAPVSLAEPDPVQDLPPKDEISREETPFAHDSTNVVGGDIPSVPGSRPSFAPAEKPSAEGAALEQAPGWGADPEKATDGVSVSGQAPGWGADPEKATDGVSVSGQAPGWGADPVHPPGLVPPPPAFVPLAALPDIPPPDAPVVKPRPVFSGRPFAGGASKTERKAQNVSPAAPRTILGVSRPVLWGTIAVFAFVFGFLFTQAGMENPDAMLLSSPRMQAPAVWVDAITRKPVTQQFLKADMDFQMGEMCLFREQYDSALSLFRDALALDPQHVGAQFRIGVCLQQNKDPAGAREAFKKAMVLKPDFPGPNLYLARLATAEKKWDEAIRYYQREYQIQPSLDVGIELTKSLHTLGRLPEAEKVVQGLKKRYPDHFLVNELTMFIQNDLNRRAP
jgi:hypothetical protein